MSEDADVKVKIGGDLSPIQRTFAQLKVQAAEAGEKAGLEFGNRTAYMAEQRVKRGMDGVLKSLATAKDPIEAIGGAIEGLASSFRIAGAAFLGLGVGLFLKEQLEKAAEGATEFYTKMDSVYAAGKDSSKEFLEESVKSFEEMKKAYGKIGFFEWLIYGAGEKKALDDAATKNEETLNRLKTLREDAYKTDAEKGSDDPKVKLQGEIDAINAEYDERVAKAKEANDDITNIELARIEAVAKARKGADKEVADSRKESAAKMAEFEDLAGKVKKERERGHVQTDGEKEAELKQNIINARSKVGIADATNHGTDAIAIEKARLDYETAITALYEFQQATQKKMLETRVSEGEKATEALKKGKDIQEEADQIGMTNAQKIAALKTKIAAEQKADKNFVGPETAEMTQNRKNQILEDQKKLKELTTIDPAKAARKKALEKDQLTAQGGLATAQAEAMGFHGQVSSLRREGFGRTPAATVGASQLKAAQAAEKHLSDIKTEISQLNAKIGGTA